MPLVRGSECALVSTIVLRNLRRFYLSFVSAYQSHASRSRYAITVDNRLARVEDAVQRLVPMAQAFEHWLQTSDQKLP